MVHYLSGRYNPIVAFQIILFFIDLTINVIAIYMRKNNGLMIILFFVQIVCTVLAFSTIFLSFFSTYIYQVGLIDLLHERFRSTLIVLLVYFLLTIGVMIWSFILQSQKYYGGDWPSNFVVLFIIHKLAAPLYYYKFKRCFLRISDPRFYEEVCT